MGSALKAVKVSEHVYWVGAIDWTIRNFHGYNTSRGTTYNAYLIMADKVTLIDTVKCNFKDELLSRISSVIDPEKIDYFVSNHTEMDHSGCFRDVVEAIKPEKIFASPNGKKALAAHFHHPYEIEALKDGGSVDLGNMKLTSVLTPMLHWPDSMVTYLDADKVMFTQDGFGLHLASTERFDDELPEYGVRYEAAKYYANILMPLSMQVKKVLKKLEELNLPIEVLANDHGPVWRKNIPKILEKYGEWADQKPTKKAVIVYASMWKSTEKMALAISDGLAGKGISVKVMCLDECHRSDVLVEILDAGAMLIGTPTLNNNMFPLVADVLCYMKGLKPKNLLAGSFGSHGWSGQGPDLVMAELEAMKLDIVDKPLKINYVPNEEALEQCRAYGEKVADMLLEKLSS